MAGFTTFAQQRILDHALGDTAWTMPTTFLALFTAAPTDAGGGTEVTGGSYARKALVGLLSAASGTAKTNALAVAFAQATALWGTATHFGVYDALTVGNLIIWGPITTPKSFDNGDTATIPIGDLDFTLD